MGNVFAASNPSPSPQGAGIVPPPPPLTAPPPVDTKLPNGKPEVSKNPGTFEELHKKCKGRFSRDREPANIRFTVILVNLSYNEFVVAL